MTPAQLDSLCREHNAMHAPPEQGPAGGGGGAPSKRRPPSTYDPSTDLVALSMMKVG